MHGRSREARKGCFDGFSAFLLSQAGILEEKGLATAAKGAKERDFKEAGVVLRSLRAEREQKGEKTVSGARLLYRRRGFA